MAKKTQTKKTPTATKVIAIVASAILLFGVIGMVVVAHGVLNLFSGDCGVKSQSYKNQVPKAAEFNNVIVMPSQPNQNVTIYDSTNGICNLDLAQSYSSTKSFNVNVSGESVVNEIGTSLKSQGYTATTKRFYKDDCGDVIGDIDYVGANMTIAVHMVTTDTLCDQAQRQNYDVFSPPQVTEADFYKQTVTVVKATVSSPENPNN